MKYFISRCSALATDVSRSVPWQDVEITKPRALKLYTDVAGPGKQNLVAMPNFNTGKEVFVRNLSFMLWGEDISEKECFKRKLSGRLWKEIQE